DRLLLVHFPDCGRRLCDAAAGRRPEHDDDRQLHRKPVRIPLRLAARLGHVVLHAVLLRGDPRGDELSSDQGAAAVSALSGLRISTWFWRGFAILVWLFLLSPLAIVILFSFANNVVTTFPMNGVSLRW